MSTFIRGMVLKLNIVIIIIGKATLKAPVLPIVCSLTGQEPASSSCRPHPFAGGHKIGVVMQPFSFLPFQKWLHGMGDAMLPSSHHGEPGTVGVMQPYSSLPTMGTPSRQGICAHFAPPPPDRRLLDKL